MSKLILLDLDGSTILSDGTVPKNLDKLIKLKSKENIWSICSGKNIFSVLSTKMASLMHDNKYPFIVDGGGCIVYPNKNILSQHHLCITSIQEAINFSRQHLHKIKYIFASLGAVEGIIYEKEKHNIICQFRFQNFTTFTDMIKKHKITKISILFSKEIPSIVAKNNWNVNEKHLDITADNVNKGSGCLEILNILEKSPKETIFVFNDKNDLPIINHPLLKDIIKIKVGYELPNIAADYYASDPHAVAPILNQLL